MEVAVELCKTAVTPIPAKKAATRLPVLLEIILRNDAPNARHIERLREGIPETISTSSMHLDIIRDYRRINTYMCTVAYNLLEQKGQLAESRLKPEVKKENTVASPGLVEEPKPAE